MQALLWGILAAFLTLVLAVVLGLVLTLLIRLMASAYTPWRAYPLPTRVALWAGVLLSAGVVGAKLARRTGWWGLALGVWLLWVVLAFLLDSAMPGGAVLFLFPALCAALLIAVVAFSPWPWGRSALAREAALIVPAFLAGVIWFQAALYFESVAGVGSSPGLALMIGLAAATVLPFLALPPERTTGRAWLIGVTAVVMVVATVAAVLVPASTPAWPEALNLYRYEDRDTGVAYRVALPWGENLPPSLSEQFNLQSVAVFPWTSSQTLAAAVQPLSVDAVPAPGLEVVSDEQGDGGRLVKVRLRSAREPREFDMGVPLAALASISVAGDTFPIDPTDASGDYCGFFCFGPSCDGLEVTLQFKTVDPVEVFIVDRSSGLPPEDESFSQARPATAVPVYDGDQTMILRRVEL